MVHDLHEPNQKPHRQTNTNRISETFQEPHNQITGNFSNSVTNSVNDSNISLFLFRSDPPAGDEGQLNQQSTEGSEQGRGRARVTCTVPECPLVTGIRIRRVSPAGLKTLNCSVAKREIELKGEDSLCHCANI